MPPSPKSLGPLVADYRSQPFSRRSSKAVLVLGVLAVLAPLFYGLYRAQYAAAKYGPVAVQYWSRPWYLLSGLAFLVLCLVVVIGLVRGLRHVAVHKYGLRIRQSGRKQYAWADLSGVSTGAVQTRLFGTALRTQHQAVIYPTVDPPVKLDNSLDGLPELLTRIKANLYPRLLPGMRQAFKEGKTLYFGPLSIRQDELLVQDHAGKNRSIPWSQIDSITVQAGMLVIALENKAKIRLPAARVPNLELLLQIIQSGVTV